MDGYLKNRKNIFPASDWFDLNFLGDFVHSTSKSKKAITEQIYKLGEEKISSRVLNHWYEAGILEDDRPNGKGWKKFSISELVWIRIIMKLRSFGLDLARIKKVKQEIDFYNSADKTSKCPLLDFHILLAANTSTPIKFIVFESGEANVLRQSEIDIANALQCISEDFISIDLNRLVAMFLKKDEIKPDYLTYLDVPKTELEKEVENSLSMEDIQSITIQVKDKDYLIDQEFFTTDKNKANTIMSALHYGKLIEKKNAGKSTYQVTNKKKITKG